MTISSSSVSVIIRVKNEESFIGFAIQSCLDFLDHPEIIVVDNNSKDDSIKVAKLFAQDNKLSTRSDRFTHLAVVQLSDYSPGRALNRGIECSSNEKIIILSSHAVICQLNVVSMFNDLDSYPALFGKQTPVYFGKKIRPSYLWSHFTDSACINMFSELEQRYFFHNAFSFVNRSFMLEHPFDEDLVGKEDRYWAQEVINSGFSIKYSPNHVAYHHYTTNGNTWKGIG